MRTAQELLATAPAAPFDAALFAAADAAMAAWKLVYRPLADAAYAAGERLDHAAEYRPEARVREASGFTIEGHTTHGGSGNRGFAPWSPVLLALREAFFAAADAAAAVPFPLETQTAMLAAITAHPITSWWGTLSEAELEELAIEGFYSPEAVLRGRMDR